MDWINTAGPIDLADLRGKFVVLDFWTYCCINCMHVLPELKKLEQAYPKNVVVIGVHSAKFSTEEDSKNIADAVQRYEIEHPVVNDANHRIWDNYAASSWPSLRIIDPMGNLVAGHSGEIQFEDMKRFFDQFLPYYRQQNLLNETPLRFDLEAYQAQQTPLRFPGKILADPSGSRLFIADSNHNRIVVAGLDGQLQAVIGTGAIGRTDGGFDQATFHHPQGMVLRGETLYVADTENHLLRKVDLQTKQVKTIAGVGQQGRGGWPGMNVSPDGPFVMPDRFVGPPLKTELNSPWALWVHGTDLYIAMAGPHQIWKMPLDEREIGPYAGNGREDIVDGPLLPSQPYEPGFASFAQPSGLSSDGTWLYVADSEGSSIRAVPFDPRQQVRTVLGTVDLPSARLFTFGDVDGAIDAPAPARARLQHALEVVYDRDKLYVADTYNNKIKVIDLKQKTCRTLAGSGKPGAADQPAAFDEPAGLSLAGSRLFVADTNNHLIRVIDLSDNNRVSTLKIEGLQPPKPPQEAVDATAAFAGAAEQAVAPATVKPAAGQIRLAVNITLPEGYKLNPAAPMGYVVEAANPSGPVDRNAIGKTSRLKQPATKFEIPLPVTSDSGDDTLRVALTYYYCREGAEGVCKVGSTRWTVPVKVSTAAQSGAIPLDLRVQ
ncbi:MAG: redoxin domain-containing protein [Planctomycetes bacterium]|nr:redoxin domain-containing protein [Planctomycetota bacterium]